MDPRAAGGVGLRALTANPLRTALSTLGVVIGVAALVAVLALGDGVEQFARAQIAASTDVQSVMVTPQTTRRVDDVAIRIDDPINLSAADAAALLATLPPGTTARRFAVAGQVLAGPSGRVGVIVDGQEGEPAGGVRLSTRAATALGVTTGDSLVIGTDRFRVTGTYDRDGPAQATIALEAFAAAGLARERPVTLTLSAERLEDVPAVLEGTRAWLATRVGADWAERVAVVSNTGRFEQVRRGMLMFKLLMGAVTGITLLVGGLGIMNVLLASVTERTREIGVRRAAGARRRDVLVQFLTEAVAVTVAGGLVGILAGYGIGAVTTAVMRRMTDSSVNIAVTWTTPVVALGAAAIVGLLFGLYPARRAARLSPIDAIRHE